MKRLLKNKLFLAVAIIVLLAIILGVTSIFTGGAASPIANAVTVMLSPFQKAYTAVVNGVTGVLDYMTGFDELKARNDELNQTMRDMEAEVREAERYKEENEKLREMLGIKKTRRDFEMEMAEIISRSDESWSEVFTIDKGTEAGIEPGDCVIVSDGLAGFVSQVGTGWSEVTSVIDTGMSAGAMITRTRDPMVCEGDFDLMKKGRLRLSYIANDATVYVGDTVETSGLGGLFPKGIMIGTITEIGVEPHGVSKYAVVQPFVDTDRLTTVFVIKSFVIEN